MFINSATELTKNKNLKTRFLVYIKDFLVSIEIKNIAFFYFEEKVTYVVTLKGDKYTINSSLNQLEEHLDESRFFRTNRMFIVSYYSISKIEPYLGKRLIVFLKPEFKTKTIVSREKVSEFKNWLGQ